MKKYLAIIIAFQFCSCEAVKLLSKQEIKTYSGCSSIEYQGKVMTLPLELEKRKTAFIFDTGASASILTDTTIISEFHKRESVSLGAAKGADGKKIQNKFLAVRVQNPLFESANKALAYVNFPRNDCATSNSFTGIMGMDLFFEKGFSLQLDFSSGQVCNLNEEQLQRNLLGNSYQLVKSKCKANQIFVFLTIEEKEYPFKLDTGYTGNIILPFDAKRTFKNPNKTELVGAVFQTISSHTSGKEWIYEKMPLLFGTYDLSAKINVSSSIKAQNIGIDFIKAFDWLIDYNHNKVYVKRNQNPVESQLSRKISYYTKVIQDRLLIVVKEKSQTQYQLGDQIIAVNGQKVTVENQCELQDFVNKTDDWTSLKLEVLPAKG